MESFLEKLIEWKDFEQFVAGLYKDSDELTVQHDVTEVGKSQAKRQVDVLVLQKTKLHTIKTIIECKRWKKPVDRQVIDVLWASVEDLNANKGAIFTTKGYEAGAIEYAKSKNIDIFVVRDIYEDEWGDPGRHVTLYLQTFHSKIDQLTFVNSRYYSPFQIRPPNNINLSVVFSEEQTYPPTHDLYDVHMQKKGGNLVKILIDVRGAILKQTMEQFNHLLDPQDGKPEIAFETKVNVDFSKYPFRYIKVGAGHITFDALTCINHQSITQTKIEIDRARSLDFALIVENYITNQKNFASKPSNSEKIILSDPITQQEEVSEDQTLKNGSLIKITLEHFVGYQLKPGTVVSKTKDQTVFLQ